MMEHIALPRLLCIAEVGWTPYENKDFSAFQKRLTADTLIFNYGDYEYGKHFIIGYKGKRRTEKTSKSKI